MIESGEVGNALIRSSGLIGEPLPVQSPDGSFHSWIVPVTVGDRLAGILRFLPDLTFMQFSGFQLHEASLEGCPEAQGWLDGNAVRERFSEQLRRGETASPPFLTYDRYPSRLAWASELTSADGKVRKLYLAGRACWEDPGSAGGKSFG